MEVYGEGFVKDQAAVVDDRYSSARADPPEGLRRGIERRAGGVGVCEPARLNDRDMLELVSAMP